MSVSFLDGLSRSDRAFAVACFDSICRAADQTAGQDERYQLLPHPQRLRLFGLVDAERRLLERFAPGFLHAAGGSAQRSALVELLLEESPRLAMALSAGGDRGELLSLALRTMVGAGRVRVFSTTDAFEDRMRATDFGDDVPAEYFRTPFDVCYFEFGSQRDFPLEMVDPDSGVHRVEGAYLFEGRAPRDWGNPASELVRCFEVMVVGSPVGKSGHLDDSFIYGSFGITDEGASIVAQMDKAVAAFRAQFRRVLNDHVFRDVVAHLAKILVYLGSRNARQEERRDGTAAALSLARGSQKPKAVRRAALAYDRIVVGPEHQARSMASGDTPCSTTRATHWRRGHLRMQRCGVRLSDVRPVWIEPVLVGCGAVPPVASAGASYVVA